MSYTRCIHDPKRYAIDVDILFNYIPGGTWNIRDNCPVLPQHSIEKGGLSNIWLSKDNGIQAIPEYLAPTRGCKEFSNPIPNQISIPYQVLVGNLFDIILRKIYGNLNMGNHAKQDPPDLFN